MKKLMLMLVVLAVFTGLAFATPAGPYRLAFVTLPIYDATSSDIDVYNGLMQLEADAAGIGIGGIYGDLEWNIIGSTATVPARDNTGTNPFDPLHDDVPIYLVDGTTKVADGNADLWDGDIDNIINKLADGNVSPGHLWVGTGTKSDGTPAGGIIPGPGPLGSPEVQQGNGGNPNEWIYQEFYVSDPTTSLPFYAMSEVIPEPATMCLLALGGLLIRRRKKA